jgi:hypothetical protein
MSTLNSPEFCPALLDFAQLCWTLPSFAGLCPALLDFAQLCWTAKKVPFFLQFFQFRI